MTSYPDLTIESLTDLKDGTKLPRFGFGTYLLDPKETEAAVLAALELGYLHIDTAEYYHNEFEVGSALNQFKKKNPNKKIYVTTKYSPLNHKAPYEVYESAVDSLKKLQGNEIDLFLLHAPDFGKVTTLQQAWRDCIRLQAEKKVRSIGVSNFNKTHLKYLENVEFKGIKADPVANQIECNPFMTRKELVDDHIERKIQVIAWGSLIKLNLSEVAETETDESFKRNLKAIDDLAAKKNKKRTQILLRWALDRGFCIIPKSKNPDRIKENANLFDFYLTKEEVEMMNNLNLNQNREKMYNPTDRTVLEDDRSKL